MDPTALPPLSLARRVGELDPVDPWGDYERLGAQIKEVILGTLPPGWMWEGRRALDFGCGPGRIMRQFAPEAKVAEIWGCDIDEPSIAWATEHLSPPFHPFLVTPQPGIDRPDGFFDLAWAISVFTHLGSSWAGWLCELHRALADDGLLMVSFLGKSVWEEIEEGPFPGEELGMCVLRAGQPWEFGGPFVYHSQWWIREHWGRAFEILSLDPGELPGQHGWVVMRKRPGAITPADLERPADDPRELRALERNLELLHAEDERIRPKYMRLVGAGPRRKLSYAFKRARARTRGR